LIENQVGRLRGWSFVVCIYKLFVI
jgi:hypothetical protein